MSQDEPETKVDLVPDVQPSDTTFSGDQVSGDPTQGGASTSVVTRSDSKTVDGELADNETRTSDSSEAYGETSTGSGTNGGGRLRRLKDSLPVTHSGSGLRRPQSGVGSGLLNLTEGAGPIVQGVMALPWWGQEEKAMDLAKALALKVRETCQTVKHLT